MNDVQIYLHKGPFKYEAGCIASLLNFSRLYSRWLADEHRALYWLQKERIRWALIDCGYEIGFSTPLLGLVRKNEQGGAIYIANLAGPESKQIDARPIVQEWGVLLPRDLTETEADKLRIRDKQSAQA